MSQIVQKPSKDPMYQITQAVAEKEDTDPLELPPLCNFVNPEALSQIIESGNTELLVEFQYYGCEVLISGDGSVIVEE